MPDAAVVADAPSPPAKGGRSLIKTLGIAVGAIAMGSGVGLGAAWSGLVAKPKIETAKPEVKHIEPPTFVELARPFTSNLRGTGRYVQLAIGISITGGTADEVKAQDVALRSAVLETLAEASDTDLADLAGKRRLRQQLATALNAAAKAVGADYKITDVYFTAFVVQ